MTIRPICSRCRHPRSLHRSGESDCTAPSCHGGPDHGPCPAYEPADARAPEPVTVAAGQPVQPMLVDVTGAARLLRLGRCTVLGLADAGELPRLKFGRSLRFATSDIEALIERKRYTGQAPRQSA